MRNSQPLTTFRNDRFGDKLALHFDEPSLSVSVLARRPDLLDKARSKERLMESLAFRRFRLRPKTRANRSLQVPQLVGFQGLKLVEYFMRCRLRHGCLVQSAHNRSEIGIQAETRLKHNGRGSSRKNFRCTG